MPEDEEFEPQDEAVVEEAPPESAPAPEEAPNVDQEPWKDPGPVRREDQVESHGEAAPLSAEEVDLESQRVDETSSLAHDRYDGETGKRLE